MPPLNSSSLIKLHPFNSIIQFSILIIISTCLILFAWLQLHNQSQTEHLIIADFWFNYKAFKAGNDWYPYVYNNVHIYPITSIIWYLDVILAYGSLKFLHLYILILNLIAMYVIGIIIKRMYSDFNLPNHYIIFAWAVFFSLWFSPPNSESFIYPLVDIIAINLLLLTGLVTIVVANIEFKNSNGICDWFAIFFYTTLVTIGVLTLEMFLIVPLTLGIEKIIRRDKKQAAFHFMIVILWVTLYLLLMRDPTIPKEKLSRNILVWIHNFLVVLSTHYVMLLKGIGINNSVAGIIGQITSLLQIIAIIIFGQFYKNEVHTHTWLRFMLFITILGIISISLAVGLRHSYIAMYQPVSRYTLYTTMFSMAVFILSIPVIQHYSNNLARIIAISIVLLNTSYVITAAIAASFYSYHAIPRFANGRLEMSIYALDKGNDRNLGPPTLDKGIKWRSDLHDFIKQRKLSVFNSPEYLFVEKKVVLSKILPTNQSNQCKYLSSALPSTNDRSKQYKIAYFSGIDADGFFFTVDLQQRINYFSFVAQPNPLDDVVYGIFPQQLLDTRNIYFAQVIHNQLSKLTLCKKQQVPLRVKYNPN
jgi:hypothetical protein